MDETGRCPSLMVRSTPGGPEEEEDGLYAARPLHCAVDSKEERRCVPPAPLGDLVSSTAPTRAVPRCAPTPVSPPGLYAARPLHCAVDSKEERRCVPPAPLGDLVSSTAPTRAVPRCAPTPALCEAGPTTTRRSNYPAAHLQAGASAVMPSLGPVIRPRPARPEFPRGLAPNRVSPEPSDRRIFSPAVWASAAPPGRPRDQAWPTGF
ncbi:hypothetical protein NDU88_001426 [Pleurodeles waltl]|uniref:Uncharacterized protein n=1 Tax=Pleurodeles waltl TaxID=8319 RepID=A0AAV7UW15_PLEWA|nr:hypothetical protein NDU88_001426 [Pleurodeles waltl]